jgi:hypothetical protein
MSSAYSSHVLTALSKIGAPAALTSAAQQSVVAGLHAAAYLPAALRGVAATAARQAFMSGLHSGSLVAAGATAVAAVATLAFLPARVRQPVPARPVSAPPASAPPALVQPAPARQPSAPQPASAHEC